MTSLLKRRHPSRSLTHIRAELAELVDRNASSRLACLVVRVRRRERLRDAGNMPQLMTSTVAAALKDAQAHGKDAIVWGALTDVYFWCAPLLGDSARFRSSHRPSRPPPAPCALINSLELRHFIKVVATPDAAQPGGFRVIVTRFQRTALYDVTSGSWSDWGDSTWQLSGTSSALVRIPPRYLHPPPSETSLCSSKRMRCARPPRRRRRTRSLFDSPRPTASFCSICSEVDKGWRRAWPCAGEKNTVYVAPRLPG